MPATSKNRPISPKTVAGVNKTDAGKSVSIADAKATFSSLVTRVETKRLPITILRRGVPVAQITPIDQPKPSSGYGWMRGTVQELGDIIGPTGVEWEAGDE
jgi:prevent-host-death family protein